LNGKPKKNMSYMRDRDENLNHFEDHTKNNSRNYGQNESNLYRRHVENVANERFHRSAEGIPAISVDDFSVLRECNRESFWYRCLPLSVAICGLMFYWAKQKNIKPRAVHLLSGTFGGWFLGKISYRRTCEERLIHSGSHSPFVTAMRRRRGLPTDETVMTTSDDQSTDWEQQSKEMFGYGSHEFAEYKDEEREPRDGERDETNAYTTYDDLRAKNRASSLKPKPNPMPSFNA